LSLSPDVIDAMVANGATVEMLAAVMKAELAAIEKERAVAQAEAQARRAAAAEKKRRQRAERPPVSPGRPAMSLDVPGTDGDMPGRPETSPETKVSPTPPSKTQTPEFTPPIVPPTNGGAGEFELVGGDAPAKPRSRGEAPPSAAEMARFEAWWRVWQNRKARQAAIPAFVRVIRAGVADDVLIAAAESYFADLKVSGYSAAHPATWLNGRRWEDEVGGAPAGEATSPERWRLMVQFFSEGTPWPENHGPEPGKPGCRAPPEILAEFNFHQHHRSAA